MVVFVNVRARQVTYMTCVELNSGLLTMQAFYHPFFISSDHMHKLKVYSLMSNRGPSQNFQNLNFLHISVALKETQFLKGIRLKSFQYEI